MIIIDDIKRAISVMMSPAAKTKKDMGIKEGLIFVYKFALIPTILAVIITLLVARATQSFVPVLGSAFSIIGTFSVIIAYILAPLSILISAAIFHTVGKALNIFKNDYNRSVTAFVYAAIPSLLLIWLMDIPLLGIAVSIVALIWYFVIVSYALANQQSTTPGKAFAVVLGTTVVIALILVAVIAVIGIGFLH